MMACSACPQGGQNIQSTRPVYGGYMEVPIPHQIPERPCRSFSTGPPFCPPQQPQCYEPHAQNDCPPEMIVMNGEGRPSFNQSSAPLSPNCYCAPGSQATTRPMSVPMGMQGQRYGFSPEQCACPENLIPKESIPPKGPVNYKGMPGYCSYLGQPPPIEIRKDKERELLHTSKEKVEKYCPKKPCLCIPPLPEKKTQTYQVETSGQKCSCKSEKEFLEESYPYTPEVLNNKYNPPPSCNIGQINDSQEKKSCYPYIGSEAWGPNAFRRPDFSTIEEQVRKLHQDDDSCLKQCSGHTPTQRTTLNMNRENEIIKHPICAGPQEYKSQVCDEGLQLQAEREFQRYKSSPQHQNCQILSRELPEKYPEVLCYCPLETTRRPEVALPEKVCSHDNPNCMCKQFIPRVHAIKETDRAKHCPQGKPDCACPSSKLLDIDPCTGNPRQGNQISQMPNDSKFQGNMSLSGNSCYLPHSDPQTSRGPIMQEQSGVTCLCPGQSSQTQPPMSIPENRFTQKSALCQPTPCICGNAPCHHTQQQVESGTPCYLPQLNDMLPPPETTTAEGKEVQKMGVIGPWATGRVDWGPLSGLTGTRPVVDRYSITRYSEGEWHKHNADVLGGADKETHHANIVDFNGRQCASYTAADTDRKQNENTKRLSQRAHDVHRSKVDLEQAIVSMAHETNLLEAQRQRLKTAMGILRMPESIAGECLERRTGRLEPDLVRDKAEEELVKEVSLVGEIRDLMGRMLKQMEEQLEHDKAIKMRTEMDWSDKKETYEIEAVNVGLRNTSTTLLFKPGAARFPDGQSTPESWEQYTKENLGLLKAELDRSIELRHFLDSFLADMARDLRAQADRVDTALAMRIAETDETRQKMENELLRTLRCIADTEKLIADLKQAIRNQDAAMKKAQTRLDNRMLRPRQESCRDILQFGLVDEVKSVGESVSALKAQLKEAEESLYGLLTTRGDLEREIIVKRKTLYIDRDRCQEIRSHYPSVAALTGH